MFSTPWRRAGGQQKGRRARCRPHVEALEDRLVPSFTPATPVAVGTNPYTVVAADFNRDGNADFAVTNPGSKSVSIRLGNGLGGFVGVPDLTNADWSSGPVPLAVGQFSNDDIPDLALGHHRVDLGIDDGWTAPYSGIGQGGFTPRGSVGYEGSDPRSLAVADFNGDGRNDYAIADAGSKGFRITTVTGDANPSAGSLISTGTAVPQFVAAGDFDRDGKQDLAIAVDVGTQGEVWVYRGDGQGGFGTPVQLPVGLQPRSVAVGDFTGDGLPDLVIANYGPGRPGSVSVWRGVGNGLFAQAPDVAVGRGPFSVVAADFNRDGRLDFATANFRDDTVSVRLGLGDGTFAALADIPAGDGPNTLAVGDVNRDGKPDLVVADYWGNAVTPLLNTFPDPPPPPAQPAARAVTASLVSVKVKGKRRLKVVVRYADTGDVKAEFNSPFQRPAYRGIAAVALDTNGDGAADAVQITGVKRGLRRKKVQRVIPA